MIQIQRFPLPWVMTAMCLAHSTVVMAADVSVSDLTPDIFFDDTTAADGNEWSINGHDAFFRVYDWEAEQTVLRFRTDTSSVAIGWAAFANGDSSTALGADASAEGITSTALGLSSSSAGHSSIALGAYTSAVGAGSTALGHSASSDGANSSALGSLASSAGSTSSALGYQATSDGVESTAMGFNASSSGAGSVALGPFATAAGADSIAVGRSASAANVASSIALGHSASSTGERSTAIGYDASSIGIGSAALGQSSVSVGHNSIAVGYSASSVGNHSIAFGYDASSDGNYSTALGYFTSSAGINSTALGYRAFADQPDTVILGSIAGVNGATAYANVGMGTHTPVEAVDVARSAAAARFQLSSYTATANEAPQFIQRRARGTAAAPAAVQNGDNLGLFSFRGYNGATMGGSRATITAQAAGTFTGASNPTRLIFSTTPVGSTTPQSVLTITPDGKVQVKGVNLNVPDYVFEDDYPLMPLDELKTFIDENGHLPGIASAQQVKEDGLDLAGSQMSLLQKVEELTLYTLQQEQRLKDMQAKSDRLEAMVSQLMQERDKS